MSEKARTRKIREACARSARGAGCRFMSPRCMNGPTSVYRRSPGFNPPSGLCLLAEAHRRASQHSPRLQLHRGVGLMELASPVGADHVDDARRVDLCPLARVGACETAAHEEVRLGGTLQIHDPPVRLRGLDAK